MLDDFVRITAAVLALLLAAVTFVPFVRMHKLQASVEELPVSVCRGEHESQCRPLEFFVGCGSATEWAQNRCREFSLVDSSDEAGGKCGYVVANVTCKVKLR